jgi:energy-coupling factor transporter transmembrane protein EcfT
VKTLVFFFLNAACFLPVLASLDLWTPPAFLALAAVLLFLRRPDRLPAFLAALAGALVLAFWVWLSNRLWTVGADPASRAVLLAVRSGALTGISASFVLGIRPAELLNEAMQITRLSPRVGFALYAALNTLPRLIDEGRHLDAVHRVRLAGKRSPLLVRAVALLARAIRSAERSSQSMASRGLETAQNRSWFRPVSWSTRDTSQLAFGLGVAVTLLAALIGAGRFRFGFY